MWRKILEFLGFISPGESVSERCEDRGDEHEREYSAQVQVDGLRARGEELSAKLCQAQQDLWRVQKEAPLYRELQDVKAWDDLEKYLSSQRPGRLFSQELATDNIPVTRILRVGLSNGYLYLVIMDSNKGFHLVFNKSEAKHLYAALGRLLRASEQTDQQQASEKKEIVR